MFIYNLFYFILIKILGDLNKMDLSKKILVLVLFLFVAGFAVAETFYEDVDIIGDLNVYSNESNNETVFSVNGDGASVHQGGLRLDPANSLYIESGFLFLEGNSDISANGNWRSSCIWSSVYNFDEPAVCADNKFQAGMQILRNLRQYKIYCCEL